MNRVERALIYALFIHLHHNIDKVIDFSEIEDLNKKVEKQQGGCPLLLVGPEANDDAAVMFLPELIGPGMLVAKMESHCSPCVPRPYDAAATGAGGAMRDIVAMGGRPLFLLDFIGTRPLKDDVLVGPCGFKGECTCGNCVTMTSGERVNLIIAGMKDMCKAMGVYLVGGGLSTSFSDIVPAVVASVIGVMVAEKPITKPAKKAGNKIIIIGETGNDGNDTLYRAGLADEMRPAQALFREERETMDATLAALCTNRINACSDLGAAGIGAICESVRFGGFGARIHLDRVPTATRDLSPEELMLCETQARMILQVDPGDVEYVIAAAKSWEEDMPVAVIGEVTEDDEEVFFYNEDVVARIPNNPSAEMLEEVAGVKK